MGACRNYRIKRVVPCRCRTSTLKNPAKCLWRLGPDRRYNFFFSPPSDLCRYIWLKYRCMWRKTPKQEAQRAIYHAPEYNVPPLRGIDKGGPFCLLIGLKQTNLVDDVEILLPVKLRWNPFSGFREVESVSTNQRPGRPSRFSDLPEKHKLGRGPWDLASCQVSMNSVQRFRRRSKKCLNQSEALAAIFFFRSARKTQTR